MIGSSNIHTTAEEFGNIQAWEMRNNLQINANKTKEMIIFRRLTKTVTYPPEPLIPGAEHVTALRVLGVVLSSRLTMGDHLDQLLSSCASSIFALRTLKSHGLRPPLLHQVARATTVASLLYASPAWWGLATAEDKSQMERLLGRLRRGGYLPAGFPSAETLAVAAHHQPFDSIATKPYHVLRCLYHEKETCGYNLRTRPHNFALPVKDDNNFVSRSL